MCTRKQMAFYSQLLVEMGKEPSEEELAKFNTLGISQASAVITDLIRQRDEYYYRRQGMKKQEGESE